MQENEDHYNKQQAQQVDACPVLPAGWRLDLKLGPDAAGEFGGVVEVWEGSEMRCRLVLTMCGQDRDAAVARVNKRVEDWVSEWLARPHSGDTDFAQLE